MEGAANGELFEVAGAGNVIVQLRWNADGSALAFRARDRGETHSLFTVAVADREIRRLTPFSQDVVDFAWTREGFAYLAKPAVEEDRLWWSAGPEIPDVQVATGLPLVEVMFPNWSKEALRRVPTELWSLIGGVQSPVVDRSTGTPIQLLTGPRLRAFSVSPNGRYAVAIAYVSNIPALWEQYETGRGRLVRRIAADPQGAELTASEILKDDSRLQQYVLVDLASGVLKPLLDAPIADFFRGWSGDIHLAWSPDSEEIAVTSTFVPLTRKTDDERSLIRPCMITVVTIGTRTTDCAIHTPDGSRQEAQSRVHDLRWSPSGRQLVAQYDVPAVATSLRSDIVERVRGRWRTRSVAVAGDAETRALAITVQEGVNKPPRLVASDGGTRRSKDIFDPNPQLAAINLGEASVYRWRDKQRREFVGGLVKPPDYVVGRRYPLVIQTHGFRPDSFLRTGGMETGQAARALAGRGIVVLQVQEPADDAFGTPREAFEDGTVVYIAGIDQLTSDGIVDAQRVGIVGHSRMGVYALTSLFREPRRFAAAAFADGDPGNLMSYWSALDYLNPRYAAGLLAFYAGEKPYGDGLAQWIERTPGFNTDKVRAPVLVTTGDPQHLLYIWPLYAALRDQNKPVDLVHMRSGRHGLTKPLDRLVHQQLLVDWFDFWLNEREDSDETKTQQYARWQRLKGQRDIHITERNQNERGFAEHATISH